MSEEIQDPYQEDSKHYYDDGNVDICVGDRHFRLHASILRLSSVFFDKLLGGDWASTDYPNPYTTSSCKHGNVISTALVSFPSVEPKAFRALVSVIYNVDRKSKLDIKNVQPILSLATEYEFLRVKKECLQFLHDEVEDSPLKVMVLAERYHNPGLYRKASAIILNDYNFYKTRAGFKWLSKDVQIKLQKLRLDDLDGFFKLSFKKWNCNVCYNCQDKISHVLKSNTNTLDKLVSWGEKCSEECSKSKMKVIRKNLKLLEPIIIHDERYFQYIKPPGDEEDIFEGDSDFDSDSDSEDDNFDENDTSENEDSSEYEECFVSGDDTSKDDTSEDDTSKDDD